MKFYKYHGLGNDYIVMDPKDIGRELITNEVIRICHRNFGVGSDGILWGPEKSDRAEFKLRILNPDGSEAEKSGNGLRIFSRYLWDQGLVKDAPFKIDTLGGVVTSTIGPNAEWIEVDMGSVSFDSKKIPVVGEKRDVINETIEINGITYTYCAATVGNPHCVVLMDEISESLALEVGPVLENEKRFPNRTNVQFLKVLDRNQIQIEIWERGAGYTLASGSSSSAAASVAKKLGLCDSQIKVHMPGGILDIHVSDDFQITMRGPVTPICEGKLWDEVFR